MEFYLKQILICLNIGKYSEKLLMKKAIILFNLGGPDKLENVQPFLFNLFNDPAILNLPTFLDIL